MGDELTHPLVILMRCIDNVRVAGNSFAVDSEVFVECFVLGCLAPINRFL